MLKRCILFENVALSRLSKLAHVHACMWLRIYIIYVCEYVSICMWLRIYIMCVCVYVTYDQVLQL